MKTYRQFIRSKKTAQARSEMAELLRSLNRAAMREEQAFIMQEVLGGFTDKQIANHLQEPISHEKAANRFGIPISMAKKLRMRKSISASTVKRIRYEIGEDKDKGRPSLFRDYPDAFPLLKRRFKDLMASGKTINAAAGIITDELRRDLNIDTNKEQIRKAFGAKPPRLGK